MTLERKSDEEAQSLGKALYDLRTAGSRTLQQVAGDTGIDVGQLSRFERGAFKRISKNLQKYTAYLQNQVVAPSTPDTDELNAVVLRLVMRSARHRAAAHAVLRALEGLN